MMEPYLACHFGIIFVIFAIVFFIMIEKQLKYFKENQKALVKEYSGRYIVISEDLQIYAFDTLEKAYVYGVENYGLGNFLLQDCRPNYVGKVQIVSPTIVYA